MSELVYRGNPGTVRVGNRTLETGDVVGPGDCDLASLQRLAGRSDFEEKPTKRKPKHKALTEDESDG